jgi:hypothetical protein
MFRQDRMRFPDVHGVIRRRLLVNFRIDPAVAQAQLPEPFRPKLRAGYAVGGICLIRLEAIRPRLIPRALGLSSENAAHRFAVTWSDATGAHEGVYIPRRDSSSLLNHLAGGRVFPGEHHRAHFEVMDRQNHVRIRMSSADGSLSLEVAGRVAAELPRGSVFQSTDEASAFFESGSLGYSATSDRTRLDGIELRTHTWKVEPLEVEAVASTYFADETRFPPGSVHFDCALIMRDIEHEWHSASDMYVERAG